MNRKEFDQQGIVSPASGKKWAFSDILRKLKERSLINAERNSSIGFFEKNVGDFGDVDLTLEVSTKLESQWSDSPTVELHDVIIPVHITVNGDWLSGFEHGIDDEVADPKDFHGVFVVSSVDTTKTIRFNFNELDKTERNEIVSFVLALEIQAQKMNILKSIQKDI